MNAKSSMARTASAVVVIAVVLPLIGCPVPPTPTPPVPALSEEPFDVIHSARYGDYDVANRSERALASSAHKHRAVPARRSRQDTLEWDRVHPKLRAWIETRPSTDIEELMVTFTDDIEVPRFPSPVVPLLRGQPADSGKVGDYFRDMSDLVNGVVRDRARRYHLDSLDLAVNYEAAFIEKYWLIQAMLVAMPLGLVDSLADREGVVYIRPNTGNPPPQTDIETEAIDGEDRVVEARKQIGTDVYHAQQQGQAWIALLDTGVRETHDLFTGDLGELASTFCAVKDCIAGGCDTGSLLHPCSLSESDAPDVEAGGHGTSSAAILIGAHRDDYEGYGGVASASLDVFKVYGSDKKVRVNAVLKALQGARLRGNHVIVVETDEVTFGDVAAAAEKAFINRAVVIAANGNNPGCSAGQPAKSPLVLGVGSYDVKPPLKPTMGHAWGVTEDGRIKPDLLAPSSTVTAGNLSDSDLHSFTGTSGAAPYAAGAAALVRDWMTLGAMDDDPGHTYAQLILAGRRKGPFGFLGRTGAGRIVLPATGQSEWVKTWVSDEFGDTEITGEVTGVRHLAAAIWWPAQTLDGHGLPIAVPSDLDLELVAPGGMSVSSQSAFGVFESVELIALQSEGEEPQSFTGTWRLKISAKSLQVSPQTVFVAIAATE